MVYIRNRRFDAGAVIVAWLALLVAWMASRHSLLLFPVYVPLFAISITCAVIALRQGKIVGSLPILVLSLYGPLHVVSSNLAYEPRPRQDLLESSSGQQPQQKRISEQPAPSPKEVVRHDLIASLLDEDISGAGVAGLEIGYSVGVDGGVSATLPVELHQSGILIYVREHDLVLRSTRTLEVLLIANSDKPIRDYAIDSDGERLAYIDSDRVYHIIDRKTEDDIALPIPCAADRRQKLSWLGPEHLGFTDPDGDLVLVFDLDTLTHEAATNLTSNGAALPRTTSPVTVEVKPIRMGSEELGDQLFIADSEGRFEKVLNGPSVPAQLRRAAVSPDGHVLATVSSRGELAIHYLRPMEIAAARHFDIPEFAASLVSYERLRLARLIDAEGSLLFDVFAPLVNPLNGRTVAPDSRTYRGLARAVSSVGDALSVQIASMVEQPIEGDVAVVRFPGTIAGQPDRPMTDGWWPISDPEQGRGLADHSNAGLPGGLLDFARRLEDEAKAGIGSNAVQRVVHAIKADELEAAEEYARSALEVDPENAEIQSLLEEILFRHAVTGVKKAQAAEDWSELISYVDAALDIKGGNAQLLRLRQKAQATLASTELDAARKAGDRDARLLALGKLAAVGLPDGDFETRRKDLLAELREDSFYFGDLYSECGVIRPAKAGQIEDLAVSKDGTKIWVVYSSGELTAIDASDPSLQERFQLPERTGRFRNQAFRLKAGGCRITWVEESMEQGRYFRSPVIKVANLSGATSGNGLSWFVDKGDSLQHDVSPDCSIYVFDSVRSARVIRIKEEGESRPRTLRVDSRLTSIGPIQFRVQGVVPTIPELRGLAFAEDSNEIMSVVHGTAGNDYVALVHAVEERSPLHEIRFSPAIQKDIRLKYCSKENRGILMSDGKAQIVDFLNESARLVPFRVDEVDPTISVSVSFDDEGAVFHNLATSAVIGRWQLGGEPVLCAIFPSSRMVVFGMGDGRVSVWKMGTSSL